jgi:hypothetical protein
VAFRHSKHFNNQLLKGKGRVIYIVKCITDIYKASVQLLHILSSYIFVAGDDEDECVSRVSIGAQTVVTR